MPILTEEERVGTLLAGRYQLDSILGRGGVGVVFAATHGWTNRRVAVKLLKPELSRDLSLTRRFLQEARAAANLSHPNVVQVLDMGNEADGAVHLVLELLEGETLGKLLEREPTLDAEEALAILVPIMDALVVAHRQGIVHRDLKPDNVFLHRDGAGRRVPKLLDFGTAKVADAAWGTATQTGTLVGTPFYMSPEQAEGRKDQGPASDVWSMGVILYRCLGGALPFFADTPTKLLLEIVAARPKPLAERAPALPPKLTTVIDRALEADVAKRFADMEAFLSALREAAETDGVAWPALPVEEEAPAHESFDPGPARDAPADVRRRRTRMLAWAAGGVAAVVASAIAVAAYRNGGAGERDDVPDPASGPLSVTVDEPSGETEAPTASTSEAATAETTAAPETTGAAEGVEGAEDTAPRTMPVPAPMTIRRGGTPPTMEAVGGASMRLPGVAEEW